MPKPAIRPVNPCFSSGPTSKHPGWSLDALDTSSLGRSHRANPAKSRLRKLIDDSRSVLGIPDDYLVGIVPASDTGAFEMAMWTMLGERGIDILAWESFGSGWVTDLTKQLKLQDVRVMSADYGELPDLSQVDCSRDVIFTWNGTTSGVCVPDAEWIDKDRSGLVFCDATSALFAMDVDWPKLDVVTWSWQKALGGEAAHGMLALSPRAVRRLESYTPPWPVPKIFRLTSSGKLIKNVFEGATINTPSMLAVEDHLEGLQWAAQNGGLDGLIARSSANLAVVSAWVANTDWVEFLASVPATLSSTSICLKIVDPWFADMDADDQQATIKKLTGLLEAEAVAYDIGSYRDAPAGIRIWGGGTIETSDIVALLAWLDWAYESIGNH
jgi:phosphoserine aminotransferase